MYSYRGKKRGSRGNVQLPSVLLLTLFPDNVPEKPGEDDLSAWVPANPAGVPASWLPFGE